MPVTGDFNTTNISDSIIIKSIHRKNENADIYFMANISRHSGQAKCVFNITGMQPELWDPVTAGMRILPAFETDKDKTTVPLDFSEAQSFFIVFRRKRTHTLPPAHRVNFPAQNEIRTLTGSWKVQFDSMWGGPARPVTFTSLSDWTTNLQNGIKYFSGTAIYTKAFDLPAYSTKLPTLYLDLGVVKHVARIILNNKDLGVVWTAPWKIKIPGGYLKTKGNILEIEITNVWANRLIGDEQEPADCGWIPGYLDKGMSLKEFPDWFLNKRPRPSKGRYCFTTWNYFTKDSPLISSGLLGPVRIVAGK
jgi:alpha-L-rhamnosidase